MRAAPMRAGRLVVFLRMGLLEGDNLIEIG